MTAIAAPASHSCRVASRTKRFQRITSITNASVNRTAIIHDETITRNAVDSEASLIPKCASVNSLSILTTGNENPHKALTITNAAMASQGKCVFRDSVGSELSIPNASTHLKRRSLTPPKKRTRRSAANPQPQLLRIRSTSGHGFHTPTKNGFYSRRVIEHFNTYPPSIIDIVEGLENRLLIDRTHPWSQ